MSETRSIMVTFMINEDLCLVLETAKRRGVNDAVSISLENRAEFVFFLRPHAALGIPTAYGVRGEAIAFVCLNQLPRFSNHDSLWLRSISWSFLRTRRRYL